MTEWVERHQGGSPLVLGFPHTGTDVPEDIFAQLNATGRQLTDTDWNVHTLFAGVAPKAGYVRALFHRYVIDANRSPDGGSLYPGQNTTGLVPVTDFDNRPIWTVKPTDTDIDQRRACHSAYHSALAAELDRARQAHGFAILFDCHSIRSEIPFLFEGTLPDINIGSFDGRSCDPAVSQILVDGFAGSDRYSSVLNGRFKGGWTTRHYGRPKDNIHAIQLEIAQSIYLKAEAAPWAFDADKAEPLRNILRTVLGNLENLKLGER